MEYTRDLGYCAAKYLLAGGNAAMISIQGGHFVPIPFNEMIDAETGRTRVRMVDINSTRYAIARRYMIRLRRDDFEDPHELAKFAATSGLSLEDFRRQFEYLLELEPPPLALDLQEGLVEPCCSSSIPNAKYHHIFPAQEDVWSVVARVKRNPLLRTVQLFVSSAAFFAVRSKSRS